jgi:photosystem II stability/assembly factor-like uncharacterized protein
MSARHLRSCLLAALATAAVLAGATPADAALSTWSSLLGLAPANSATWVRVYTPDPTAPGTIYAGTEGNGVFKSTNNGGTWTAFSTGLPTPSNVRSITVVGSKVYTGTSDGLFSSSGGGGWQPVAQGAEPNPAKPSRLNEPVQALLAVGGTLIAGTASGGIFRSTDGGGSWTPPPAANGMPHPTTVWDLTSFGPLVYAATDSGIYVSDDGGATWELSSDGISGTVLHVIRDETTPNTLYAATDGGGIYRTLNLGVTWVPINDGPTHANDLGNLTTHGLQQSKGKNVTRLFVPTYNGLYSGTTDNGATPGPVRWHKVDDTGLNQGNVMWALSGFGSVPSTLLAGTQSGGGYAMTLQPPTNQTKPLITGTLTAGQTVTGTTGVWSGTQTIDYDYQWQACPTTVASGCTDIPGEVAPTYVLSQQTDYNHYVRLKITAHNDAPSLADPPVAYSDVSTKIQASPTQLPGYNQLGNPSVSTNPSIPAVGDTLTADPAPISGSGLTLIFQWLRCDENGDSCVAIPGATAATYKLTTADGGHRLRVQETASNQYGKATTDVSGPSNKIVPDPAKNVVPPKLHGSATLGSTLVGDVGTWVSPTTTWERQWERCEANGTGCASIINATSPGYVLTAQDVGQRVRLRVTADVNESYALPSPVLAYTPLSAVVTKPGGGVVVPPKDTTKPVVRKLSAKSSKSSTALAVTLSEKASLTVTITKTTKGHRVGKKCKSGKKKHAKSCTITTTIGKLTANAPAGASTVTVGKKVGKKSLGKGSYRASIVPKDAAGNVGQAKAVGFTRR